MKDDYSLEEEILVAITKTGTRGFLTQNEHRAFEQTYGKERMLIAIKGLIDDGLVNQCLIKFGLAGLTVVAGKMTLTPKGKVAANELIADED